MRRNSGGFQPRNADHCHLASPRRRSEFLHGRSSDSQAAYLPQLPSPWPDQCFPLGRSFLLTAAGQFRILTGFPFQPGHELGNREAENHSIMWFAEGKAQNVVDNMRFAGGRVRGGEGRQHRGKGGIGWPLRLLYDPSLNPSPATLLRDPSLERLHDCYAPPWFEKRGYS